MDYCHVKLCIGASGIGNTRAERHPELVSGSPRIIREILKQVQDDVPIMVLTNLA